METFDPGCAEPYAWFAAGTAEDVAEAVAAAKRAERGEWRKATPVERGRVLMRTAELIRQNVDRLAMAEVLDSGKTLGEARGDVGGSARTFEYYAGASDKQEGKTYPLGPDYTSYSIHEPIDMPVDRAGACGRLHRYNQASGADTHDRAAAGGNPRPGGAAEGRVQRRDRDRT
jgi:acyl-CoA reductase-like NAD-dependent aldehyde dehydrogenase